MDAIIQGLSTTAKAAPSWRGEFIPWYGPTCSAVICYVMKLRSSPEYGILSDILEHMADLSTEITELSTCMSCNYDRYDAFAIEQSGREISGLFVDSFIPKVQRFFTVPKLEQLSEEDKQLKPVEILSGFLGFLVQVLNCEIEYGSDSSLHLVRDELILVLSILGDVPLRCNLGHEIDGLLAQVEIWANGVGCFLYSYVFTVPQVEASWCLELENTLLEKAEILKARIREYYIKLNELPMPSVLSPGSDAVVDPFFVVDSLLEDLESMMCRSIESTLDYQIRMLHQNFVQAMVMQQDRDIGNRLNRPLIHELRDLAYEAEYLINSYAAGNIPIWYLSLRIPSIIQKFDRINKMSIMKNIEGSDVRQVSSSWRRPIRNPVALDDHNLSAGFEDNMTMVLGDLVGRPKTARQVVLIYGMPGLGKTTLASKLYNCPSICDYFTRRVWCVVSETYSETDLLIHILRTLTRDIKEEKIFQMDVPELGVAIHQTLMHRRYLIVIDDVWQSDVWYGLQRYFPDDRNGSRVLLTSRIKDVAPCWSIFHTLPLLSNDQCWDLLQKRVFRSDEKCPQELLNIGKGIASKCSGLPLAVVITAGILVNVDKNESAWKRVENQLNVFLLDDQTGYRPVLELSYEQLPHSMKPCFLYFAAFPQDTEISVKKLIWWWISEGFIQRGEMSAEDVGKSYLLELINRSLVMTSTKKSDGEMKTCRIHDLLHDMCVRKAYEENFLKFSKNDIHISIYEKHQHLCAPWKSAQQGPFGLHCRSLIGCFSHISSYLPTMPLLKVADQLATNTGFVWGTKTTHCLPIHLRFLGTSELQKGMLDNLVNLKFLCVKSYHGIDVPLEVILKLKKLGHLVIKREVQILEGDSNSSRETTNLRSLSCLRIDKDTDEQILRCSPNLREVKCICGGETEFPDLCFLTQLESLKMVFKGHLTSEISPKVKFPLTITKLCLDGLGLPWENMSIIGRLWNLRVLKLRGNELTYTGEVWETVEGEVWETVEGEFLELRFLQIEAHGLKQWISYSEHFPRLERLRLNRCVNLIEIPGDLGHVSTLEKIEVAWCSKEASLSAVQIMKEQHDEYGNDKLQIIIVNKEWTKEQLVQEVE